jgi:hypothetical protein
LNAATQQIPSPKVIIEADGQVVTDSEAFSARHAELVSRDLAPLATLIDAAATVVFRRPLNPAFCQPAWGRTLQLLASGQHFP